MQSFQSTDDLIARSARVRRVRQILPSGVVSLHNHSPQRYLRGRRAMRVHGRYLAELRESWKSTAIHCEASVRRAAAALDERGIAFTSLDDRDGALDRALRSFDFPERVVEVREGVWGYPPSVDPQPEEPPQISFLRHEHLLRDQSLARLLCGARLLAPMERRLGCNVKLASIYVYRCERTAAGPTRNMRWHHDNQPPGCHKLMIYLSDVAEGTGEFEYLAGSQGDARVIPGFGFSEMPRSVEPERYERIACTGPGGTAFYFDNNGYHRGGYVRTVAPRNVVVATYRPTVGVGLEDLERDGFGGYLQEDTWGPDPERPYW